MLKFNYLVQMNTKTFSIMFFPFSRSYNNAKLFKSFVLSSQIHLTHTEHWRCLCLPFTIWLRCSFVSIYNILYKLVVRWNERRKNFCYKTFLNDLTCWETDVLPMWYRGLNELLKYSLFCGYLFKLHLRLNRTLVFGIKL